MRSSTANAVRGATLTALVAAGLGWAVTDSSVTLKVDGVARVVHTHARTVQALLHAHGLSIGEHDVLTPGLEAPVTPGLQIALDRGRLVTITQDGRTKHVWLTARSVDEALTHLGLGREQVRVSASRHARLPLSGLTLTVDTRKQVTLVVAGARREVTTYAPTVEALAADEGLHLGDRDITEPTRDTALTDGATVTVRRVTVRAATETVPVPAPLSRQFDRQLMLDQQRIADPGAPGRVEQSVEYLYADGRQVARTIVRTRTLSAPRPRVVVSGTVPYPADDTGLNWTALARCESHNNPHAVSSGGTYHGLYQFNVQMWQRMGGIGLPSEATPREQTYRAIRLYKASGRGQWPVCGTFL